MDCSSLRTGCELPTRLSLTCFHEESGSLYQTENKHFPRAHSSCHWQVPGPRDSKDWSYSPSAGRHLHVHCPPPGTGAAIRQITKVENSSAYFTLQRPQIASQLKKEKPHNASWISLSWRQLTTLASMPGAEFQPQTTLFKQFLT